MNWIETLITVLIGSGGCGVLGWVLSARSTRRKAAAEAGIQEAEASIKEIEADERQIAYLKKELADAYAQLDHVQDLMDQKRAKLLELSRKVGELELRLIEEERLRKLAQYNECKRDCPDRQPPRASAPIRTQKQNDGFLKE
jgi:peptidoglycan hydrolase CwlO-like protein